jgi:hypothetical protein
MSEDFFITIALLGLATLILIVRGRGDIVGRRIGQAVRLIRSTRPIDLKHAIMSNPLLQLTVLFLLLIGTGWAATIFQIGIEDTHRAIEFKRSTTQEARECHLSQEIAALNIELDAQVEDVVLAPGPLDPRLNYKCPTGGVYSLDESGHLNCSKHGRAPQARPVTIQAARRDH